MIEASSELTTTMGAYVTGKWGQLGLIRTLQQELRAYTSTQINR